MHADRFAANRSSRPVFLGAPTRPGQGKGVGVARGDTVGASQDIRALALPVLAPLEHRNRNAGLGEAQRRDGSGETEPITMACFALPAPLLLLSLQPARAMPVASRDER
ncbi:MAG: hypothetical protein IPG06_20455 [Haliea sp.]|nr:hypothetical protein [Haliea sp.]